MGVRLDLMNDRRRVRACWWPMLGEGRIPRKLKKRLKAIYYIPWGLPPWHQRRHAQVRDGAIVWL